MELLKDQWSRGVYTDTSNTATAVLNAKAIGMCEVCDGIINLEYEQLEGVLTDD